MNWKRGLAIAGVVVGIILGTWSVLLSMASVADAAKTGPLMASLPGLHEPGRTIGSPNARVVIDVYSDFLCSHCADMHHSVEPDLIRRYVQTGRARLVIHPVSYVGPESGRAAEAALCADDQGRFWEYREELYAAYTVSGKGAYEADSLKNIASKVGLDRVAFDASLDGGKYAEQVKAETAKAKEVGAEFVPTTFVNGRKIEGAVPLADFVKVIDEELAK